MQATVVLECRPIVGETTHDAVVNYGRDGHVKLAIARAAIRGS
jgi:hypothetical protein